MPSNLNLNFESRLQQHFTSAELCDFMGITVEQLIDAFPDVIEENYRELLEEIQ